MIYDITHALAKIEAHESQDDYLKLNCLQFNFIDSDLGDMISAIKDNLNIIKLDMSNNNLGDKAIVQLLQLTQLEELDISVNNIMKEGAKAIASHSNLKLLYINYNSIGSEGAKALAENTLLGELNIEQNNLPPEAMEPFARNTTLHTLWVGGNKIGDAGACILAKNKNLINLYLYEAGITDIGAEALAANKYINNLDFSYNEIADVGVEALANNKVLLRLQLAKNNFNLQAAELFLKNNSLIELAVPYNNFDDSFFMEHVEKHLAENRKRLIQERNQFVITTLMFALWFYRNKEIPKPTQSAEKSILEDIPAEIFVHILCYLNFPSKRYYYRSGKDFAQYIFDKRAEINDLMKEWGSKATLTYNEYLNSNPRLPSKFSYFWKYPKIKDKIDDDNDLPPAKKICY